MRDQEKMVGSKAILLRLCEVSATLNVAPERTNRQFV